jgi:hypothetical protein
LFHLARPELDVDVAYLRTAEQTRRLRTGELELALIRHAREADGKGDPTLHDHLTTLLATAGHRFFDVRETTGEDARSLLLAAAENQCVAIAPASTREIVGDIASLVNTRPLEPVLRTPDTALAWRVTPPPELEPIVAAARQAAADLYTRSTQDGSPPDR